MGDTRPRGQNGDGGALPPQVVSAISDLQRALDALDEIGEAHAAALTASALHRLKANWGLET